MIHCNRPFLRCLLTIALMSPATVAQSQEPAGTAQGAQESAVTTGTTPSAKELYALRRYVEAAHAFEAMDTTNALYNAGMARAGAGHLAHALLRWARYRELKVDLTEPERAAIVRLMGEARQRTVPVHFVTAMAPEPRTLVVQPPQGLVVDALLVPWPAGQTSVTVYLDVGTWSAALRTERGTSPARPLMVREGEAALEVNFTSVPRTSPVRLRIGPTRALKRGINVAWVGPGKTEERRFVGADTRWELPPGAWRLGARARGYEPVERSVAVTERPVDVELTLRRDRLEQARVGLGVSLGLAGMGLIASGGVLFVLGRVDKSAANALDGVLNPFSAAKLHVVRSDLQRHSGGVALVSAGAGTTIVALTAGLGGAERALGAEAAIGAAFLAVGIPWLVNAQKCPYGLPGADNVTYEPTYDALRTCAIKEVPSALLFGTGAGLLGGALVALATRGALRRKASRLRASTTLSTNHWAVSVQGKF